VFDPKTQKCVCAEGFKEFNQIGLLSKCLPVCGDGVLLLDYEQCDDKNIVNNDGCDQNCKVEDGFTCMQEQPSKCILHLNFEVIVFDYAYRVEAQNKGIFSFTIQPIHPGLEKMAWENLVSFNFSSSSVDKSQLRFSYSPSTGQLLVTVPYNEELENTNLESLFALDPKYVVSKISTFLLTNKLNGVNAPLVFEHESMLDTHKNISTISLVMILLLLLQFYIGSHFHKMIGLETIQTIQTIYFVRMVSTSSQTSLLSSMNLIQYSASGYENAQLLFGSL